MSSAPSSKSTVNTDLPEFPLGIIHPSPLNPRKRFAEEALTDLANSIRLFGVQQAITIRPMPKARASQANEHDFEIVMGERRYRAAQIAGLDRIPVIVRQMNDSEMIREALSENLNRADLSAIEVARGYKMALEQHPGLTQEALAKQFNTTQSNISKHLGLLDLPDDVQEYLLTGQMSASHGFLLAPLIAHPAKVSAVAGQVVAVSMSVSQLSGIVSELKKRVEADDKQAVLTWDQVSTAPAPLQNNETPNEPTPTKTLPTTPPIAHTTGNTDTVSPVSKNPVLETPPPAVQVGNTQGESTGGEIATAKAESQPAEPSDVPVAVEPPQPVTGAALSPPSIPATRKPVTGLLWEDQQEYLAGQGMSLFAALDRLRTINLSSDAYDALMQVTAFYNKKRPGERALLPGEVLDSVVLSSASQKGLIHSPTEFQRNSGQSHETKEASIGYESIP